MSEAEQDGDECAFEAATRPKIKRFVMSWKTHDVMNPGMPVHHRIISPPWTDAESRAKALEWLVIYFDDHPDQRVFAFRPQSSAKCEICQDSGLEFFGREYSE